MNDLRHTLDRAVPEPPDLLDLARRAEAGGRRRRARRRGALAAGAAAVVAAAALVVPSLVTSAPRPADPAAYVGKGGCAALPDLDHPDLSTGTPVWVRFCAPPVLMDDLERGGAIVPSATLRVGVPELVEGWSTAQGCDSDTFGARTFSIQVGYADDTVGQLAGDTSCLPAPYAALMAALADRGTASALPDCPATLPYAEFDGRKDVAAALAATAVTSGRLCRYDADMQRTDAGDALDASQAERVRSTALGSFQPHRTWRCERDLPTSWSVLLTGTDGEVYAVTAYSTRGCNPGLTVSDGERSTSLTDAGDGLVELLTSLG
jgi:hypothetical protein